MKDKELLLKAIDDYHILTPSGKKILKALVRFEVDDIAVTNTKELNKLYNISRPTLYAIFKLLADMGFIERRATQGSRQSSFSLKYNKLDKIIEHYLCKQDTPK